jgi:hypothetical protein
LKVEACFCLRDRHTGPNDLNLEMAALAMSAR